MKTIAYCRVSTDDQAQFGISLAAQEQKIRQYGQLYTLEIAEVVTDAGLSAKDLKRPGMQRIIGMVRRREVAVIIVAKLDRLTRSVRDLAELVELLNKYGVSLVSVNEHIDTGSAAGRMILNMLGVIAQWEREQTGERVAAIIDYRRSRGESYSGRYAPYGYERRDGRLVPVTEEQRAIAAIMSMEGRSLAEIGRELQKAGLRTRQGGTEWHHKVLRKILEDAPARQKIDAGQQEVCRAA